jgi:hypothetical protein
MNRIKTPTPARLITISRDIFPRLLDTRDGGRTGRQAVDGQTGRRLDPVNLFAVMFGVSWVQVCRVNPITPQLTKEKV